MASSAAATSQVHPDALGSVRAAEGARPAITDQGMAFEIRARAGRGSTATGGLEFLAPSVESTRAANRAITLQTIAPRQNELLAERERLVTKKFESGLSREEERRLQYTRWQLDRIDDALHGEELDGLERYVEMHEKLAELVGHYTAEVRQAWSRRTLRR